MPLSGLANQGMIMQGSHYELYSMPRPSSDLDMHQPAIPALLLNQPFTSGLYAVWGEEKVTICRCMICVQAGCDLAVMERLAKGGNNHKYCEFIEVYSLN